MHKLKSRFNPLTLSLSLLLILMVFTYIGLSSPTFAQPITELGFGLKLPANSPYTASQVLGQTDYRVFGQEEAASLQSPLWQGGIKQYTLKLTKTGMPVGVLTLKELKLTTLNQTYTHVALEPIAGAALAPASQILPTLQLQVVLPSATYSRTALNPGAGAAYYQSTAQKDSFFLSALQYYVPLSTGGVKRVYPTATSAKTQKATVQNKVLTLGLPVVKGSYSEYWMLAGPSALLDTKQKTEMDLLARMDYDKKRQWSLMGNMYPIPTDYVGSGPDRFWHNYAYHVGNKLMLQGSSALSQGLAQVAAQHIVALYPKTGFYNTPFGVNRLNTEYGLKATFYDTRFNTDAAQFLANLVKRYQLPQAQEALDTHIAFFKDYAKQSVIHISETITLPTDYANLSIDFEGNLQVAANKAPTHMSLNHVLAEIIVLLDHYSLTGDASSLEEAEKLLDGLEALGEGWITEKGDLWYGYDILRGFVYTDYIDVTLNDLRDLQERIRTLKGGPSEFIDYLIAVKQAYVTAFLQK